MLRRVRSVKVQTSVATPYEYWEELARDRVRYEEEKKRIADFTIAEELCALVGKSAGAICRTLNLLYKPPYQSVIDAASKIAYDEDRFMSAWSFVTQWLDGTTIWRAEDGEAVAVVAPDGSVRVRSGYSP